VPLLSQRSGSLPGHAAAVRGLLSREIALRAPMLPLSDRPSQRESLAHVLAVASSRSRPRFEALLLFFFLLARLSVSDRHRHDLALHATLCLERHC